MINKNLKSVILILAIVSMIGILTSCSKNGSDEWYEVDQSTGVLTVNLPDEKEGYEWDFTINDADMLKADKEVNSDGIYTVSFKAMADGETLVSFFYTMGDEMAEIRGLNITSKNGKVTEVSKASLMPMNEEDNSETQSQ